MSASKNLDKKTFSCHSLDQAIQRIKTKTKICFVTITMTLPPPRLVNEWHFDVNAQISGEKTNKQTKFDIVISLTSHLNHNPPQESLPQSHSRASQIHHICFHIQSIAFLQHCGDTIYKKDRVKCKNQDQRDKTVHSMTKRKRNKKGWLTFHRVFPKAHRT